MKKSLGNGIRVTCVVDDKQQEFSVVAMDKESIWSLKQKLYEQCDIFPSVTNLYTKAKGDKPLKNSSDLRSCGLKDGSTVYLRVQAQQDTSLTQRLFKSTPGKSPGNVTQEHVFSSFKKLNPGASFAFGAGLRKAVMNYPVSFTIFFATIKGKQVHARDVVDSLEISVPDVDVDFEIEPRQDGTCNVTYIPRGSSSASNLLIVRVNGKDIKDSPFGLQVKRLREDNRGESLVNLMRQPDWCYVVSELLIHLAGVEEDYDTVFSTGMEPIFGMLELEHSDAMVTRLKRGIGTFLELLLRDDRNKEAVARDFGLKFIQLCIESAVWTVAPHLHNYVCRFLTTAFRARPETCEELFQLISSSKFFVITSEMRVNVRWQRWFAHCVSEMHLVQDFEPKLVVECLYAVTEMVSISRDQEVKVAASRFISHLRTKNAVGVLAVDGAVRLLVEALESASDSWKLLALEFISNAGQEQRLITTLWDKGLISHVLSQLADVGIGGLWEATVVTAFLGAQGRLQTPRETLLQTQLDRYATQEHTSIALIDCVSALVRTDETGSVRAGVKLTLISRLVQMTRGASEALAWRAFDLLQLVMSKSHTDHLSVKFIRAHGIGAAIELLARSWRKENEERALEVLRLLGALCSATDEANHVNQLGFSWLLEQMLSKEVSEEFRTQVIIVLVYFARLERYKARIVEGGGKDFLTELIGRVRRQEIEILRQIDKNDVDLVREIGSGACSRVWLGSWRNKDVAVKVFNEKYQAFRVREFASELAIMAVLRHPNICHTWGGSTVAGDRFLVMPLYRRGSLLEVVRDEKLELSMWRILNMCLDAARGMAYLHEVGVIHRDLKSGNLLVDDEWRLAVVDFGISRMLDINMSTKNIGTPIYTAPEILTGKQYDFSADVFSYSFIMWELFARTEPYKKLTKAMVIMRVCEEAYRPPMPKSTPPAISHLIERCWAQEPSERPNFPLIVKHLQRMIANVGTMATLKPLE